MAGISCYCLSSRSLLESSLLVVKGKRRGFQIKAQVEFVIAEEAKKLVAVEGYTVLDVRDKTQFERAHIRNSYHVPLFIENTDNDLGTIVKRQLHNNFAGLFFGLPFTKPNPEFVQSVKSQFSPETKLLLVCQEGLRLYHCPIEIGRRISGGNKGVVVLEKVQPFSVATLQGLDLLHDPAAAAQRLEGAGYDNIACITSGLQTVKPGTFDSIGSKELQDAGKAGLVTIQGKISAVLGTVLICALIFVTFFPDQAEQLLQMAPSR